MGVDNKTTALLPFVNGRPPHIPCGHGDIAKDVLFPGDPDRVALLADMMDDVKNFGRKREFAAITGTFQGHRLTICSGGIGGPSTEIALVELSMLGAKRVLRIGGMSALIPEIRIGSYVVARHTIGQTGVGDMYAGKGAICRADQYICEALSKAAVELGHSVSSGTIATTDSYYSGQDRPISSSEELDNKSSEHLAQFRSDGAIGVDMESHVVLSVSKKLGLEAGCLLGVHGNRATDDWLIDYEKTQRDLFTIAGTALLSSAT